jgi:hypothetical protein
VKAGVRGFIASHYGGNSQNAKGTELFPLMKSKAKTTDYLKSREQTGLIWTAIATGSFFDLHALTFTPLFLLAGP